MSNKIYLKYNLLIVILLLVLLTINIKIIIVYSNFKKLQQLVTLNSNEDISKNNNFLWQYNEAIELDSLFQYNKVVNRNDIILLQFFRPEVSVHRDILLSTDIFATNYLDKVTFVAIGMGGLDWLIVENVKIKNIKLIADKSFSLQKRYKASSLNGLTIIIDQKNKVKFAWSGIIKPELLFQLLRKYSKEN